MVSVKFPFVSLCRGHSSLSHKTQPFGIWTFMLHLVSLRHYLLYPCFKASFLKKKTNISRGRRRPVQTIWLLFPNLALLHSVELSALYLIRVVTMDIFALCPILGVEQINFCWGLFFVLFWLCYPHWSFWIASFFSFKCRPYEAKLKPRELVSCRSLVPNVFNKAAFLSAPEYSSICYIYNFQGYLTLLLNGGMGKCV